MKLSQDCSNLITNQHNKGKFVKHDEAKALLDHYFKDEGKPQLSRKDPDHVFGYLFGLVRLKELILKIDAYNAEVVDPEKQFTAVRIYHAKSQRANSIGLRGDLLLVPVKRSGVDYPISLAEPAFADPEIILCDSGPCPNICEQLYFFK